MKKTYLVPVILFALASLFSADYQYAETVDGERRDASVSLTADAESGQQTLIAKDPSTGDLHTIKMDSRFETIEWSCQSENGDSFSVVREGKILLIEWARGGQYGKEEREIDQDPWYASIDFGLTGFIRSGREEAEFWTLNPENFKTYKMTATRTDGDSFEYGSLSVSATGVRVTASGVPAIFFKMKYLMRESDGIRLLFEGKQGGPGSPKIISRLVGEE